ncbi:MILDEW RESISTANCE LOCUS O 12 [Hibiscus trionum]|uniref:MLO-like protein n=1 Tax=Hibiscus trionum TaxID=183268 RepID=A0A9W7IWX8_HIBTR|nr:MILDEW RESISTANCE LOCUS O 12 [Hibiscus trionum]
MAGGYSKERSLEETPTWAVAVVCAIFVVISILIEHGINSLGKWFQRRQKKAMMEALEKIKAELMLLGFISLLLTIGTYSIPAICIPEKIGYSMLPCKRKSDNYGGDGDKGGDKGDDGDGKRKLLSYDEDMVWRRVLAGSASKDSCSEGKVALISQSGMHDLHIFIFALAVFHVLYSVATIFLAMAKMKKWEAWESETKTLEYQYTNDPSRFRLTHQTSFVKRHSGFSAMPGIKWIVAFFRQFFGSVSKVDYLTMRNGFINAHFAANARFDFHKYIKRSMEDDFKVVVGISTPLWGLAIVFLLLNVYKWQTLTWLSLVPLMILLVVGTKLELIIMEMAEEIQNRSAVVRGAPVVEPNNKFFWFNRPQWTLFLIHYTLFQNAFQMAYFLWVWFKYSLGSCINDKIYFVIGRVVLGVGLQILCSYITFPLYALVTQMGSHMKKSIFEEQTAKALKNWHKAAKKRNKNKAKGDGSIGMNSHVSPSMSCDTTPSRGTSPMHLLHSHKHRSTTGDQTDGIFNSPTHSTYSYPSDTEISDIEASPPPRHVTPPVDHHRLQQQQQHNVDFSFDKP